MSHIRVDMSNIKNKLIKFELANIDIFIIHIGFELTNINMINTLTR